VILRTILVFNEGKPTIIKLFKLVLALISTSLNRGRNKFLFFCDVLKTWGDFLMRESLLEPNHVKYQPCAMLLEIQIQHIVTLCFVTREL
jgi:hypothetical protein